MTCLLLLAKSQIRLVMHLQVRAINANSFTLTFSPSADIKPLLSEWNSVRLIIKNTRKIQSIF